MGGFMSGQKLVVWPGRECFTDLRKLSTASPLNGRPQKERYRDMRKYLMMIMALGALAALTVAGFARAAGSTEEVTVGNLKFKAGGSFSPKALSKTQQTPIALTAEGKISTVNGEHPPALKEALVETDKNG